MFDDLIEFEEVLEWEPEVVGFSNVRFKKDFGPIKAGQEFNSVWFRLEDSEVAAYASQTGEDEDEPAHQFKFQLVAA